MSISASKAVSVGECQRTKGSGATRDAGIDNDDEDDFFPWPLTGQETQELAKAADSAVAPPETPHKALKTGVYATPATTTSKRRLPWLEQPTTPAITLTNDHLDTPSISVSTTSTLAEDLGETTPRPGDPPALSITAATPSPPSRYTNALLNPADSASTLTSEALATLSSTSISANALSDLRSVLSRHDLRMQGVVRGRDITRLALKAKDAKIAELQMRIERLEADG